MKTYKKDVLNYIGDPSIHIRVSWDYDEIRECVSNMKIGETKILEV